jgi:hypothetical protein
MDTNKPSTSGVELEVNKALRQTIEKNLAEYETYLSLMREETGSSLNQSVIPGVEGICKELMQLQNTLSSQESIAKVKVESLHQKFQAIKMIADFLKFYTNFPQPIQLASQVRGIEELAKTHLANLTKDNFDLGIYSQFDYFKNMFEALPKIDADKQSDLKIWLDIANEYQQGLKLSAGVKEAHKHVDDSIDILIKWIDDKWNAKKADIFPPPKKDFIDTVLITMPDATISCFQNPVTYAPQTPTISVGKIIQRAGEYAEKGVDNRDQVAHKIISTHDTDTEKAWPDIKFCADMLGNFDALKSQVERIAKLTPEDIENNMVEALLEGVNRLKESIIKQIKDNQKLNVNDVTKIENVLDNYDQELKKIIELKTPKIEVEAVLQPPSSREKIRNSFRGLFPKKSAISTPATSISKPTTTRMAPRLSPTQQPVNVTATSAVPPPSQNVVQDAGSPTISPSTPEPEASGVPNVGPQQQQELDRRLRAAAYQVKKSVITSENSPVNEVTSSDTPQSQHVLKLGSRKSIKVNLKIDEKEAAELAFQNNPDLTTFRSQQGANFHEFIKIDGNIYVYPNASDLQDKPSGLKVSGFDKAKFAFSIEVERVPPVVVGIKRKGHLPRLVSHKELFNKPKFYKSKEFKILRKNTASRETRYLLNFLALADWVHEKKQELGAYPPIAFGLLLKDLNTECGKFLDKIDQDPNLSEEVKSKWRDDLETALAYDPTQKFTKKEQTTSLDELDDVFQRIQTEAISHLDKDIDRAAVIEAEKKPIRVNIKNGIKECTAFINPTNALKANAVFNKDLFSSRRTKNPIG